MPRVGEEAKRGAEEEEEEEEGRSTAARERGTRDAGAQATRGADDARATQHLRDVARRPHDASLINISVCCAAAKATAVRV